jgi:hypothetical protein
VNSNGCEGDTFRATNVCAVVSSVTGAYDAGELCWKVMLFGMITATVSVTIAGFGVSSKLPE